MTQVLVPIAADTLAQAQRDVERAFALGADGIELRLDLMPDLGDPDIRALCAAVPALAPILLTIRSQSEGGEYDGDDDDRISRLIALGPHVRAIDVEHVLWRRSANIRHKVVLALRRARHVSQESGRERIEHEGRRRLVLSRHFFGGRPATLSAELIAMLAEPACDVVKIAWTARTIRDNFEAFDLMRESAKPLIAVCMGEAGILSRVLCRKFGAYAAFAALDAAGRTAPGQVTLEELKRKYRWNAIKSDTAVFGVVGHPVAHSLSPRIHNAAFAAARVNACYLPMLVTPGYEPFKAFMAEVLARPWFGLRGLSITAPHKQNALCFVRERSGRIDESADRIGAANTINVGAGGELSAANTDMKAVVDSLCTGMNVSAADLKDLRVHVLGAGGVARAMVAGLSAAGARVVVFNRSADRGEALATEFGCAHAAWDDRTRNAPDLLINATTLGQSPRTRDTPIPAEALDAKTVVFDAIYHPRPTRLLAEARERGCRTIDGLEMFLLQAAAQWRLWFDREPPAGVMREAVLRRFQK
ncbi:MAG: type I 3-dehydroquinate dehydratase [Phycisphaerae bacterium]